MDVDYIGFDIPDESSSAMGWTSDEVYRNLPYIAVLKPIFTPDFEQFGAAMLPDDRSVELILPQLLGNCRLLSAQRDSLRRRGTVRDAVLRRPA